MLKKKTFNTLHHSLNSHSKKNTPNDPHTLQSPKKQHPLKHGPTVGYAVQTSSGRRIYFHF